MCMTSTKSYIGGYGSPSNLPYSEDDTTMAACQLASFGGGASSCSWPTPTIATMATPIVSACSSPHTPPLLPDGEPRLKKQRLVSLPTAEQPLPLPPQDAAMTPAVHNAKPLSKRRNLQQDLPLPLKRRTCETPKERFAAFVAIVLMHLDGGGTARRNYKLSMQAKALVAECCRRNQMGDVHFTPLQESLSDRLHGLVGEDNWNRCRSYLNVFLARHHGFCPGKDEQEEDLLLLHYKKRETSVPSSPPRVAAASSATKTQKRRRRR